MLRAACRQQIDALSFWAHFMMTTMRSLHVHSPDTQPWHLCPDFNKHLHCIMYMEVAGAYFGLLVC